MDKPASLTFSDEAIFRFFRAEILIPLVIIISGFIAAYIFSDGSFSELVVPGAAMSFTFLVWVGILVVFAWGHRVREKTLINRMFTGEIWECWQFSSSEWQKLVEAECNLINTKDDGLNPYIGAVYSSIFGIVIAVIIIVIGMFAIKEPEIKTMMWIIALIVFLLFMGAGLIQPTVAKYNEDRYRGKALRFAEPRVWFAPKSIYHESLGYTSLKDLEKVTDQTRSRKSIQFTLQFISDDSSDDFVKLSFPVPSDSEQQVGRLVRRYREEILNK